MDLNSLAVKYKAGIIDGFHLSSMLKNNEITKSERRKIVKLAKLKRYNSFPDIMKLLSLTLSFILLLIVMIKKRTN